MARMPQHSKNRLVRAMLKPVNTAAIIILGVTTFIWGFWIGNPFWEVFTHAQLYSWMDILPEWFWGGLAMVVGITMVYGVITRSFRKLKLACVVGFYHWLMIALMYFGGDWQNTGGVISLMLSLYCGFLWINLNVNQKSLQDKDNPDMLID